MSLRSKKNITICRPIPAFIPRQLALGVLHDHAEVITLNPLVLSHQRIKPPVDAPADEAESIWYEITERIQFIPGLGKAGASTIQFNGVFHDVPWGLQTHIYAPMSIDMRAQYRIAGSQAGIEKSAPRELGLENIGAPKEGLYLRADIEFKCNVALASFVAKTSTGAIGEMVSRMVKKAEQLDADVLQGMIKEERDLVVTRTQSKESDPYARPYITQTQSTPVMPPQNKWPSQGIKHAQTEVSELATPQINFPAQQERQQKPQNASQQNRASYAPPTHVVELDGGDSAVSDRSSWNQAPQSNGNNYVAYNMNSNYSYPQTQRPPSRGHSPTPPNPPHQRQSSYSSQQQQPQAQPQQPQAQYQYTYNPQTYSSQSADQSATRQHSQYKLPSQQRQYQAAQNYPPPPPGPPPQQQQRGPQQQHVPQMESGRKYSFDADRLQPEGLLQVRPTDQRRWSGVGL